MSRIEPAWIETARTELQLLVGKTKFEVMLSTADSVRKEDIGIIPNLA